jgi:hypothetical protein
MEADDQTERMGYVWRTLRTIAAELERLNIPYAVLGGIGLQHFGLQRSTRDVVLLVRSQHDLERLHAHVIGHGFGRKSPASRHLRDEVTHVRVEFLIAGEFPGDGQPKPVAFPDPTTVGERSADGLVFVNLPKLIELKLASAKSAPPANEGPLRRARAHSPAETARQLRRKARSLRTG